MAYKEYTASNLSVVCNLHQLYDALVERIEPDYGLLDILRSDSVFSRIQIADIKAQTTVYERNRKLLTLLLDSRKLVDNSKKFVDALREKSQLHITNYIQHIGVYHADLNDCWPLSDQQLDKLDASLSTLVECLEMLSLVPQLYSAECICRQQKEAIDAIPETSNKIRKLADILSRKSVANYNQFLNYIGEEQQFVAESFRKEGLLNEIHADLVESSVSNVSDTERETENGYEEFLVRLPRNEAGARLCELLRSLGLNLDAVRRTRSIGSFFYCETLKSLLNLRQLFENGTLKETLETVFGTLSKNPNVRILNLRWNQQEYEQSVLYFIGSYSRMFRQQSFYRMYTSRSPEIEMTMLPAELLAIIVGRSFHPLSTSLDDSSTAWRSLASVCQDFHRTLRHSVMVRRASRAEEKFREEEMERKVEEELRQLAEKRRKLQEELKRIEESKKELKQKLESESQLSFMAGEGPSLGISPSLEPQSKPHGEEEEGDDSGSEDP